MPNFFTDKNGAVFVQSAPGDPTYPLLCANVGEIGETPGDVSGPMCLDENARYVSGHRTQGAPSAATVTIEPRLQQNQTWLERFLANRCPFIFYAHDVCGSPADIFSAYVRGQVLKYPFITAAKTTNFMKRAVAEGDGATDSMQSFDLKAEPNAPRYWPLIITTHGLTEAKPLRDIASCGVSQCASACGPQVLACNDLVAVTDGDVAIKANVWFGHDAGKTWTVGAALPFAVTEAASAVECFLTGNRQSRVLVARGTTDAGNPAEVGYTDDRAVTWHLVDLPTPDGEFVSWGNALFAPKHNRMWLGTNAGGIYKSVDAAATWVQQTVVASPAGEPIRCIDFVDENHGWAGGGLQLLVYTADGGDHWNNSPTAPGTADSIYNGASVHTQFKVWLCGQDTNTSIAQLFRTTDGGRNWVDYLPRLYAALNFPGGTIENLGDIKFTDELCGYICGAVNTGTARLVVTFRTVNGGWDWEAYFDPNNAVTVFNYTGGVAVLPCDNYNHFFTAGEVSDATSLVFIEEGLPVGGVS